MPIRDLAEVGARLEETVRNHPDGDLSDPRRLARASPHAHRSHRGGIGG